VNLTRVGVVGTSCSGKTTFARRLASILGTQCFELEPHPISSFPRRRVCVFGRNHLTLPRGKGGLDEDQRSGADGRRSPRTLCALKVVFRPTWPIEARRTLKPEGGRGSQ